MEIWYFETSAVNFFMDGRSVESALATKQLQLNKGRDWRISPVTLWEILMTSDERRREEIIYFCQHLFGRELLPSPSELIVSYIEQGMPMVEKPRKLISESNIANVWRDLVDDRDRTFILDHEDLRRRAKLIQSFTKEIHNLIKFGDLILSADKSYAGFDASLSSMVKEIPFIKEGEPTTDELRLQYKVSLYYILTILCAEAELENGPIKKFWENLGIHSTLDRAWYVIKELSTLIHRGPFIVMSCMTISQAKGKYPRGVWFDSLHSMYVTYADKIFTSDGHFQGLRDVIPAPTLRERIHHMDEVEISNHPMNQFGVRNT